MNRFSIRWLLLGVATASLLLPALVIFSLRHFDAVLIRQTERELNAQGAVIASSYQQYWAAVRGTQAGNPRDRWHDTNSFTPFYSAIRDTEFRADALPAQLPKKKGERSVHEQEIGRRLSGILRNAQVFNLSGVRVLDEEGCAIASSRAQLDLCFGALPEVEAALNGKRRAVLRTRSSDEPAPSLSSFSRRGDARVFVALPVWNDGEILGAVLLSRTAQSGLEWLFKQRRDVFYSLLLSIAMAVGISWSFSLLITRPLRKMRKALLDPDQEQVLLGEISAPSEIHTLGVALDERAKQLRQRSRYVAEFAANVSHELKTPLTSIQGAAELLGEQGDEMKREQRLRFARNIDAAAKRTTRLVNRLLQLARLEVPQDSIDEDEVRLGDFLAGLEKRYAPSIEVQISGDGRRRLPLSVLESVCTNLIENALRYRREQPVRLKIEVPAGAAELTHFEVIDDGPGISEENQTRLFERFFTTERDHGGTGLGLSIVQASAKLRGGEVKITSSSEGTRVHVWL